MLDSITPSGDSEIGQPSLSMEDIPVLNRYSIKKEVWEMDYLGQQWPITHYLSPFTISADRRPAIPDFTRKK
jgi:hypothetical protein